MAPPPHGAAPVQCVWALGPLSEGEATFSCVFCGLPQIVDSKLV